MSLIPFALPPGIARDGTTGVSKGRYFDAWHTRWNDNDTVKPTGGWRQRGTDIVTGSARACIAWKDNGGVSWLGVGTHSGLFVQNRAGDVFDITPTPFTTGRANAVSGTGYGKGPYGVGPYGTPRPDTTLVQPATQWTLDNWGEYLVGVSPDDGKIVQWELNTADEAEAVLNAPDCKALVVTPEGFLFALASTNPRTVSWCDQRDNTLWAPDETNQAGDFELQTKGALMCGKVVTAGTLLFTDLEAHMASYIGGNNVFGIRPVGSACGIISRQAVAAIDNRAVWMGQDRFWLYDGYVQELPCELQDYVFGDFNALQASKTYAVRDSANSEVLFYYCSGSSNEIDRCAVWNYKRGFWNLGRVARTCGTDRGAFSYPIFLTSAGEIFEHEVGLNYDGTMPYSEIGPIEAGDGNRTAKYYGAIPDELHSGDVTLTFYCRDRPNSPEVVRGPYAVKPKTDFRFDARMARMRISGATASDWRFGTCRLDIRAGSGR